MNERELRRDKERLFAALDYILTAYYYKPEQLDAEIQGARELIEDMGMEKPEWAREVKR